VVTDGQEVEYELVEASEEDSDQVDLTTPLLGLSAGEEKSFTVKRPQVEDEDEESESQEVTISVQVHSVAEKEIFPLDDDFAQMVGDFDTLDELKEKLTQDLLEAKQDKADKELFEEALDKIVEDATRIEWHKSMEERELDSLLDRQDKQLQQDGLNLDMYLSVNRKTKDEWRAELLPGIQDQLRRSLVSSKIAADEEIDVERDEMAAHLNVVSEMASKSQELRDSLTGPGGMERFVQSILLSKVRERVVQIVKGEYSPEAVEAAEEAEESAEADQAEEAEEADQAEEAAGSEVEPQVEAEASDSVEEKPEE
jgi:trigger factor